MEKREPDLNAGGQDNNEKRKRGASGKEKEKNRNEGRGQPGTQISSAQGTEVQTLDQKRTGNGKKKVGTETRMEAGGETGTGGATVGSIRAAKRFVRG